MFFFLKKKLDFLLNVHPFVPLKAPSPIVLYFNCALFLSSMMCYNIPGLSGILDFSYIYVLEKKEPLFLLILQEKQSVFPCSLRSS